ncbi:hypothetical protein COCVIDRAFT_117043, partial [Bipolaris victoriae FI3]
GYVTCYPAKTEYPAKYRIVMNFRIVCYPRHPAKRQKDKIDGIVGLEAIRI